MKNVIFLAFVLLFGFNAFAQEQMINKNVSLSMSEKLTTLSKEEAITMKRKNLKKL